MRFIATSFLFLLAVIPAAAAAPQLTYLPRPPLHVAGNRLLDASGATFLLRGTAMPFKIAADSTFLTASTFSQIGLRWNMNALRLQLSVAMDLADPTYIAQVKRIVHDANAMHLVVILAPHDETDLNGASTPRMIPFWQKWAAAFRDEPMVLFDLYSEPKSNGVPGHVTNVHSATDWNFWLNGGSLTDGHSSPGMQALADAVRAQGAQQVIVAMVPDENPLLAGFDATDMLNDGNILYEVCPLHADNRTDADRDQHFGEVAAKVAVIANNWDLQLDKDNTECQSIPTDLTQASNLVKADLDFFDNHAISWTSSVFTPGKLIKDDVEFFPTQLNAAWACGHPATPSPGMGEVLRYHLWGAPDDAAIPVNGAAGGLAVSPGSVGVVYGQPVLTRANGIAQLPLTPGPLAGTTVQITDAAGDSRLAALFYVAASSINFVVPADLKPGLLKVDVRNEGGPNLSGTLLVLPVAPGLFSATGNGRGPVIGFTVGSDSLVFSCDALTCATTPIPATGDQPTLIRLIGTGIRFAAPDSLHVTIGGKNAPVVSYGSFDEAMGTDQIVIAIGSEFKGMGEADLFLTAGDQVANCVRINIE